MPADTENPKIKSDSHGEPIEAESNEHQSDHESEASSDSSCSFDCKCAPAITFRTFIYPIWPLHSLGPYSSIEEVPFAHWDPYERAAIFACVEAGSGLDRSFSKDACFLVRGQVYKDGLIENAERIPLWLLLGIAEYISGDRYRARMIISNCVATWGVCRYPYTERPNDHVLFGYWATYALDKLLALDMGTLPMMPHANSRLPFPDASRMAASTSAEWPSSSARRHFGLDVQGLANPHSYLALEHLVRLATIIEEAIYITWHDHRRTSDEKRKWVKSLTAWKRNLPSELYLDHRVAEQIALSPGIAHLHMVANTLNIFIQAEMDYFQPPQMTDILLSRRARQAAADNARIVNCMYPSMILSYRHEMYYMVALSGILLGGVALIRRGTEEQAESLSYLRTVTTALPEILCSISLARGRRLITLLILRRVLESMMNYVESGICSPCLCGTVFPKPDDRALADPLRRLIAFTCAHIHKVDQNSLGDPIDKLASKKRKSDIGLDAPDNVDDDDHLLRKRRTSGPSLNSAAEPNGASVPDKAGECDGQGQGSGIGLSGNDAKDGTSEAAQSEIVSGDKRESGSEDEEGEGQEAPKRMVQEVSDSAPVEIGMAMSDDKNEPAIPSDDTTM